MVKRLRKLLRLNSQNSDSTGAGSRSRIDIIPLAILGILGIILILIGSARYVQKPGHVEPSPPLGLRDTEIGASDYVSDLESSLERAISQMRGIGSVSVVVTLETDRQTIYATSSSNDTERIEEHDSSGGVRTTQRSTTTTEPIVVRKSGGNEELVMVGVEPPKVRGVLVVAEGASTPEVRLEIAQAVSSALGVALHRVAVVEKEV